MKLLYLHIFLLFISSCSPNLCVDEEINKIKNENKILKSDIEYLNSHTEKGLPRKFDKIIYKNESKLFLNESNSFLFRHDRKNYLFYAISMALINNDREGYYAGYKILATSMNYDTYNYVNNFVLFFYSKNIELGGVDQKEDWLNSGVAIENVNFSNFYLKQTFER